MRTKGCCSTGLAISLALLAFSLTQTTCSRSLSADSAAWDGTLELAVDAELGKLHAFLRTTAGQSPYGQKLTRTLTLTNWEDFSGQQRWTSGSRVLVLGTSDPNFPVRVTATSVTLLAAATSHWANRFNVPDAEGYAAKSKSSASNITGSDQGARRQAAAIRPGLKVLVVRPKFPAGCWAGSGATCSKAAWTATMNANDFTGVNTMLSTCTWNGVTLGGGVTITDDVNLACPARTQTCDDLFNVVYDASNAALASTYNLNSFDHVVYDLQSQRANFPSCGWLGMAVMGGQWIYMHGNCFAGTTMHEMGHNYNLDHSGAYDTDGTVADYGDGSCIMGYQTSFYAPYNANGTGGDIKCFSSPHIYRMGLASYPVISPSNLPAGAITTRSLAVHWTGPTQALRLTGWGGSDFFLSYEYDGEAGALQATLLVHQHPVTNPATQDTISFMHTVLAYGSSFALPGTNLVVRIKSMSVDRSNVTVDICAKSSSQTCAFANDVIGEGPEYLRLRTTANPTWCLAVCSTAAGTECQPAGWAVSQQRAVVLKRDGCTATDDWSLWWVDSPSNHTSPSPALRLLQGLQGPAALSGSLANLPPRCDSLAKATIDLSADQGLSAVAVGAGAGLSWAAACGTRQRAGAWMPVSSPATLRAGANLLSPTPRASPGGFSPVASGQGRVCCMCWWGKLGGGGGCSVAALCSALTSSPGYCSTRALCPFSATECYATTQTGRRHTSLALWATHGTSPGCTGLLVGLTADVALPVSWLRGPVYTSRVNMLSSPVPNQYTNGCPVICTASSAPCNSLLPVASQRGTTGQYAMLTFYFCDTTTSIFNAAPSERYPTQGDNRRATSCSCILQGLGTPGQLWHDGMSEVRCDGPSQPISTMCMQLGHRAAYTPRFLQLSVRALLLLAGSCGTPLTMAGLPSSGVSIFNPSATTCGAANSWSCRGSRDFLYLLPSSSMARNITLDTCVSGVAAWDSFLYVIPVQPNTCFQCTTAVAFDDDSSPCGGALSRVTFPAAGGVAYWVVVEGWGATN
ncbi:expressed protein, partial [Haematococcus lacustris]